MLTQIVLLIILILMNGYFALMEMAFISINDAKVDKKAKGGDKKAIQIKNMLDNPSSFLATIQIGITIVGFLTSAFASETFAEVLAPILNNLIPSISLDVWKNIAIIVITIILSFFTLVFGELVPKRIAMKYCEKIAYWTIGSVRAIATFTSPFVKLLTKTTNLVSKLFGVTEQDEEIVTEEEIKMMVEEGEEKGTIDQEEKEFINNIFEFDDITTSEIMTPRTDIFAIDIKSDLLTELKAIDEYKYSRIPVYEESIDDIKGILYIKDLIKKLAHDDKNNIEELIRKPYFVPENKPINELFKEFKKSKNHIAIVVDEYGGTAGLITLEDVLEELVGNIFDEYDDIENDYSKIDENTYAIKGTINIHDLKKLLEIEIPDGDYETLSGYLINLLGRVPNDDEKPTVETENMTYKIEKCEDKRIVWVKACRNREL